ncbi:Predicted kinase, aminoglycoside phosphotransferase (APT) family [Micromonospora nigra]|uniref:Predicted kinase, aminoglycoside phosphotransferase (APT) family n=1 Tax=Micromonospora nigra TaxID=145857 RepID=A0A1C6RJW9_9ACTN|nr:phosphotransferase [Micromonospora nigra]SCL17481.1 Predicted kinase, aminoglycoside phosphotransferase (APT) family [Micromonospora nigra]
MHPAYPTSTRRPGWAALPPRLRAALAGRLGAPVVAVRTAEAGFTRGFAGVLTTADGDRAFVKAAPAAGQPHLVDWYAREAAILDRLPVDLPAPRLRWALREAGWYALCLDAVDGRVPRSPWHPAELTATLDAYARVAAALAEPPAELVALGLPHLADLARTDILWWEEVAAGRESVPAGLPPPLRARLPELVALESRLPGYAAAAGGLVHGDLRRDNVLVDREGRAWCCDWTWLCRGPAWFDLATLLLSGRDHPAAAGSAPAPDARRTEPPATAEPPPATADPPDLDCAFAEHPAAADAPPDALDVTLAALAGYHLTAAASSPATASADRPAHQRRTGGHALDWLARRQGWT